MEITTQQIDEYLRLQRQSQTTQHSPATNGTFDEILSDALTSPSAQGAVSPNPGTGQTEMICKMLLGSVDTQDEAYSAIDPVQSAYNSASGTIELWNTYAQKLNNSQESTNLKDAYSILENIDQRVAKLKTNTVALQSPEFNSLVNDLEVLTTTERIKFNRGDYA